jgi:ribosomal protein S18 acetylase RimI-like enzyme
VPVRLLTPEDAAVYWSLRLRALREHPEAYLTSYEESIDTPLAEVSGRLSLLENAVFGAFDQAGALVGIAGAFREKRAKVRHKATIVGVYVAPEARGQGVGAAVVGAAVECARGWEGVTQLHLAVAVPNEPAQRLYRSLGFRTYGLEPRAIRLPDRYVDEEHMVLVVG